MLKKIILLAALAIPLSSLTSQAQNQAAEQTIYHFKVAGLLGDTIDFSAFRGKKILIVNTASECGFTPQYEGLETLHKKYGEKLVIVGFPSNDFGKQEPGTATEIAEFCEKNYGVSFPMAAKVQVKGAGQAPIYQWLTQKDLNGQCGSKVKWNFQKYLLDEQGVLRHCFASKVKPLSPEILDAIEE